MKKLSSLLIILVVSLPLLAQGNYNEAMLQGDAALNNADYTTAIKKYLIAKEFAPNKRDDVLKKLNNVYAAIDKTKKELEQTKTDLSSIKKELEQTKTKLNTTQAELDKTKTNSSNTNQPTESKQQGQTKTSTENCDKLKADLETSKLTAEFYKEFSKLPDNKFKSVCKELKYTPNNGDKKQKLESLFNNYKTDKERQNMINAIKKVLR